MSDIFGEDKRRDMKRRTESPKAPKRPEAVKSAPGTAKIALPKPQAVKPPKYTLPKLPAVKPRIATPKGQSSVKGANTFYTKPVNSGIMPNSVKPASLAQFRKEIDEHRQAIAAIDQQQYNEMLKGGKPDSLNALKAQRESALKALQEQYAQAMGLGEKKPKNQLHGSRMTDDYRETMQQRMKGDSQPGSEANEEKNFWDGFRKGLGLNEGEEVGGGLRDIGFAAQDTAAHMPGMIQDDYLYIQDSEGENEPSPEPGPHPSPEPDSSSTPEPLPAEEPNPLVDVNVYITEDEFQTLFAEIKEQNGWSGGPIPGAGTLIENRSLSEKVEEAQENTYETEEDAAVAFAAEAIPETGEDYLERGAVIIQIQAPIVDECGNITYEKRYLLGETFSGNHADVIDGLISTYLQLAPDIPLTGISVSFVHTHPYCTGHIENQFSGKEGDTAVEIIVEAASRLLSGEGLDNFGDYLGDEQVPWLPGVDRIYLASPTEQELYACDAKGPILDSNGDYQVMGTYQAMIVNELQE